MLPPLKDIISVCEREREREIERERERERVKKNKIDFSLAVRHTQELL